VGSRPKIARKVGDEPLLCGPLTNEPSILTILVLYAPVILLFFHFFSLYKLKVCLLVLQKKRLFVRMKTYFYSYPTSLVSY
jgi:hypothetical protein